MKKVLIGALCALMCVGILSACTTLGNLDGPSGADKAAIELLSEKYEKISDAETINETVTVTNGTLLQYKSEKNYEKTAGGYTLTEKVQRLNNLDADNAYPTVTESEPRTVSSGQFSATLKIDEQYYTTWKVTGTSLEATVKEESFKEALGITKDLPAAVLNLTLKLTADVNNLTKIEISYSTSEASTVAIVIVFGY